MGKQGEGGLECVGACGLPHAQVPHVVSGKHVSASAEQRSHERSVVFLDSQKKRCPPAVRAAVALHS